MIGREQSHTYCRACRYDLAGLTAGACPECGAHFDPLDPETYFASPRTRPLSFWFTAICLVCSAGPLIELALIHLTLVGARISLGRWPHRMGMDDPKDLTGVGAALYLLAGLGMMLLPLSFAFTIVGVVIHAFRGRMWMGVYLIAVLGASWAIAGAVIRADPAQALVWFMD